MGSLEPKWPLSLVQIDHTVVDVIVVDTMTRAPIRRPWLTLAIDVYSRCVVGLHLSLEPPCATSVALCIAHAVLSKSAWLCERKIDAEWPMEVLIEHIHLDNAKEFHSEALRRWLWAVWCGDRVPACAHASLRWPHRAIDRYDDGEGPSFSRNDFLQRE